MLKTSHNINSMKAGVWYTVNSFINSGFIYLTIPIFTRLLTVEQFGRFNNYMAWLEIFLIISSLCLQYTINRAYIDFKNDFNGYLSSISVLVFIISLFAFVLFSFFESRLHSIINIEIDFIKLMIMYSLFHNIYSFYLSQQRAIGEYKSSSILSTSTALVTFLVSVYLVFSMEDKYAGRIIGYIIPQSIVGLVILVLIILRGKKVKFEYIKYAVYISVPLIPHYLASKVLTSSDRIVITQYLGTEATAIYSLAYSCSMVIDIMIRSINLAFVPWLFSSLHEHNTMNVKKNCNILLFLFMFVVIGIMLISPEILYVAGGKNYYEALWVMPAVMIGYVFQFAYMYYTSVELYLKKTMYMSFGTIIAGITNIVLNIIFVPIYGYIAAAFTTLFCYIILFFFHYFIILKTRYHDLLDNSLVLKCMLVMLLFMLFVYFLYCFNFIRFIALILYIASLVYLFIKRKKFYNILDYKQEHKIND